MESDAGKKNFSDLRGRVQAFLTAKPEAAVIVQDDIRKLIHELDTYQIELELQNEDLRNAQEELEKSRRRYADLYEFSPLAYFTVSDAGMIIEANLTAADMLGLGRGELYNRPFSDFIVAEEQDLFYRHRKKLLETRQKQAFELRMIKMGGSFIQAHVETIDGDEDLIPRGQFRLMVCDISVRRAEEFDRLRRLKDRYRAIVMDQAEMICRFDPQGRITFVNDAYCRFFGVTEQEILGTNYLPNIHAEDLPLVREHFKYLTPLEPVKTIEHRVHLPDGRVSWQQWCGRALFDRDGRVIECQAVGRDITRLKETKEKLEKELRLRQLFMDALPCVALLLKSSTFEIVASNKAALGVGAVPGTHCYATWAQRKSQCPWCTAPKIWEIGETQNHHYWARGKYWDAFWIRIDEELCLHYAFDHTEQQINKEALKKAKDELEQRVMERTLELQKSHEQLLHSEKLAAVGNLSASIAHEFNNPLQSIMTIIKGISQYAALDKKEAKLVELALQECQRMKGLIANLQDFYRPSTGKVESVDLHNVLDALLMMTKKDFQTRNITVVKEYAVNLRLIPGVIDQLKQVFLNLLSNAADACEGGGIITMLTQPLGRDSVAVRVRDNGVGIEPANIGRLFEPFYTTKPDLKGTGLGLSVSYGIIKKHGGRIEVESERGKGSQFSVILPVREEKHEHENDTAGR
jgi:PAS domain S-box-containing protein